MQAFNKLLANVESAILDPLITLIVVIAVAVFLFGVGQFVAGAADEETRTKGKRNIVWGLVGLTIIFGTKAIIALLAATVNAS
jgi:hypothetical protein